MIYKMNLLPEELRKVKKVNTRDFVIRVIVLSLIGLLIVSEIAFAAILGSLKYKTAKIQDEIMRVEPSVNEAQQLLKQNQETNLRIEEFKKLVPSSESWADILENISAAMPANIWLIHLNLNDKNQLIIEGNADKLSTLGNFMAGLRSIKNFKSVNLTSANGNLDGVKFTLSIERGE